MKPGYEYIRYLMHSGGSLTLSLVFHRKDGPWDVYTGNMAVYLLISSQSPVIIADGVDSSPTEYIFSYNGSPISVSTSSTLQCSSSSCQHTFRVTSSQAQQYTVTVNARNVVGVGTASRPVTVGMLNYYKSSRLQLHNYDGYTVV